MFAKDTEEFVNQHGLVVRVLDIVFFARMHRFAFYYAETVETLYQKNHRSKKIRELTFEPDARLQ
jgi:hypothetical protein